MLPEHGDWVRLGEDSPNEFAFGVIGRFWGGATTWKQIDSSAFTSFESPGYAKFSLPYFAVSNIAEALETVEALGGGVVHPGEIWAICKDSEGSPFGLTQESPNE